MGECGPLTTGPPRAEWAAGIRRIASLPNVYCKVSALVQMAVNVPAPVDPAFYHPVIDVVWNAFGTERLIYASNWPQIERVSDFATAHRIVADYFAEKGAEAEENFYWRTPNVCTNGDAILDSMTNRYLLQASPKVSEHLKRKASSSNPMI